MSGLFDLSTEPGVLRASIAGTVAVAGFGIVLGLFAGSFSIMFDGVYSLVDAGMGVLSLVIVNLITAFARAEISSPRLRERFTMGFWHLEPLVLATNGLLLMGVATYALVNAVGSLLNGGRMLSFDIAIVYAVVTLAICATIAVVEARANRRIGSALVALDVRSWIMSGGITAALLVAFAVGAGVAGTRHAWIAPYLDPAVLALVCLVIIPLPIGSVRRALSEILLVAPPETKRRVDAACATFAAEQGFDGWRAYVAKAGRGRNFEIYFLVPPDAPPRTIGEWDALRDAAAARIGEDDPHLWLTIVFTADPAWA